MGHIYYLTQLEYSTNPKTELNYDTRCANFSIVAKKNTEIVLFISSVIINLHFRQLSHVLQPSIYRSKLA